MYKLGLTVIENNIYKTYIIKEGVPIDYGSGNTPAESVAEAFCKIGLLSKD